MFPNGEWTFQYDKWQAVLKRLYFTLRERRGKDAESQQSGYGLDASGNAADVWQR